MDERELSNYLSFIGAKFYEIKSKSHLLLLREFILDVSNKRCIDTIANQSVLSVVEQTKDSSLRELIDLIKDVTSNEFKLLANIVKCKSVCNIPREELLHLFVEKLNKEISERADEVIDVIGSKLVTVRVPSDFTFEGLSENLLKQLDLSPQILIMIQSKIKDGQVELEPELAENFDSLICFFNARKRQQQMQTEHPVGISSVDIEIRGEIIAETERVQKRLEEILLLIDNRVKIGFHFLGKNEVQNALITFELTNQTLSEGFILNQQYQLGDYQLKNRNADVMDGIIRCLKETKDPEQYKRIIGYYRSNQLYQINDAFSVKSRMRILEHDYFMLIHDNPQYMAEIKEIVKVNRLDDFAIYMLSPLISMKCNEIKGKEYVINGRRRAELSSSIFLEFYENFCEGKSSSELCAYFRIAIFEQKKYDQTLVLGKIYDRFIENWNKIYWSLYTNIVETPTTNRSNEDQLLQHMKNKLELRIGGEIALYREIINLFSRLVSAAIPDLDFTSEMYSDEGRHAVNKSIRIIKKCYQYIEIVSHYIPMLTRDVIEDYRKDFNILILKFLFEVCNINDVLSTQCDIRSTNVAELFRSICSTYRSTLGKHMKPPEDFMIMEMKFYYTYANGLKTLGFFDRALPNYEYVYKLNPTDETKFVVDSCRRTIDLLESTKKSKHKAEGRIREARELISQLNENLNKIEEDLGKVLEEEIRNQLLTLRETSLAKINKLDDEINKDSKEFLSV